MRSARIFLATAAASAVLAFGAPGAFAAGGDWGHDDSSQGDGSSHGKEHGEDNGREAPRGGMHTGGGALAAVNDDGDWGGPRDPKTDPDTYRDDSWGRDHDHGRDQDHDGGGRGKDNWGGDHDRPRGGMHTGGGALAAPTTTTGGLAVLGVVATGLYAARRRKPAVGMA
jgi:hypothetical protein